MFLNVIRWGKTLLVQYKKRNLEEIGGCAMPCGAKQGPFSGRAGRAVDFDFLQVAKIAQKPPAPASK